MNLIVACPSCKTIFQMVREQLDASDGRVRCGHCMEVFNAQAQLIPPSSPSTPEGVAQYDRLTPESLSFVQTAKKDQFWADPMLRVALIMLLVALLALLFMQILRNDQARLARFFPSLTNISKSLCQAWPCVNRPIQKIGDWRIENSSFQKENATAFRLTATLKNEAEGRLIMPHMELQLLDSNESLIVRRVLAIETGQALHVLGPFEKSYHWLISPNANDNAKLGSDRLIGYRLVLFYP